MITQLTAAQKAQITPYRRKWREVTLSTQRINKKEAEQAIQMAYKVYGFPAPSIILYAKSPNDGFQVLADWLGYDLDGAGQWGEMEAHLGQPIVFEDIREKVIQHLLAEVGDLERFIDYPPLSGYVGSQIHMELGAELFARMVNPSPTFGEVNSPREMLLYYLAYGRYFTSEILCDLASYPDFCFEVLGCPLIPEWSAMKALLLNCGWVLAFEKVCVICDRPTKIFYNIGHRLHAEGKPAIEFADGFSFERYRGVTLPEKYKVNLHNWCSEWLLDENDPKLRRVLLEELGYERVCQELGAERVDAEHSGTLSLVNSPSQGQLGLLKIDYPSGFSNYQAIPYSERVTKNYMCYIDGTDLNEFPCD